MFIYFFQSFVFANDELKIKQFNSLIDKKNYYEVDLHINAEYFGKITAPKKKVMNRAQKTVSTINEFKEENCVTKTQFIYFIRSDDFHNAQSLFGMEETESSFSYEIKDFPAQLQVVCLNCDNNVNQDFRSLYYNNTIKNCTQGG